MLKGCDLIAQERQRQIEKEGWSTEHDKSHTNNELAWAAACYAAPESIFRILGGYGGGPFYSNPWPWSEEWDKRKQHGRLKQLVIAGALIAAEIDRLIDDNVEKFQEQL